MGTGGFVFIESQIPRLTKSAFRYLEIRCAITFSAEGSSVLALLGFWISQFLDSSVFRFAGSSTFRFGVSGFEELRIWRELRLQSHSLVVARRQGLSVIYLYTHLCFFNSYI